MPKSLNKFLKAMRVVVGLLPSHLPIELWLQIFDHIDKHDLISLTQVNPALCGVAEAVLYHTVTLRWEVEVNKFLESTRSRPRRAGYVVSITLVDIDKSDEHIHGVLPSLLNSLPHLQFLRVEEIPGEGIACCTAISRARLPQLRTLVAGMRSSPSALLDFLAAHENLQEVDLRYTFVVDEPSSRPIEGTVSPAVRTLTCRTPFLNCRPPIPSNLTHLYRPSFLLPQLPLLALHAGPQLVSLRLGSIFPLDRFRPWSLLDVVSRFPRLRFLQVDMIASHLGSTQGSSTGTKSGHHGQTVTQA
uniref:Beta-xylanase (EC) n=1 Tax=Ganoderma boninense TaxID=34458 RepID=A0A5K1K0W4_9APHY|nr:Beta-xylanase (EC [Ganoderma boninense]